MIENMTNEQAAECLKTIHVLSFKDETATFFLTDVQNAFKLAIKALENQHERAKWEETEIVMEGKKHKPAEFDTMDGFICDNCGYTSYVKSNYCPYCGADMEG